jgi:predicted dehydrogenase
MAPALRAAVVGASGMGKHHAKWLHALGCEVVGFAGSSAQSVEATAGALRELFGFRGQGYVGVQALLERERPDLVAICTPPALHFEHFMAAAEAGCHILCEKPLVYDAQATHEQLLRQADQMVAIAQSQSLVAAVNTQYVAAAEPYWELCRSVGADVSPATFQRFFMRMDSRGGRAGASGAKIWIDLASHPLSLLMRFAGPGAIVPGSEQCQKEESRVSAKFEYAAADRRIEAHIEVCNVPEGPLTRRFGVDDVLVDYEGRNDEQGIYAAYLRLGDRELKATDFVQTSIRRFVEAAQGTGVPLATAADGRDNLRMQLQLLAAAS